MNIQFLSVFGVKIIVVTLVYLIMKIFHVKIEIDSHVSLHIVKNVTMMDNVRLLIQKNYLSHQWYVKNKDL